MTTRPNHYRSLTSLRGVAAIAVMFHNLALVAFPDVIAFLPSKFFIKSYLWVDLFFLLSGFVLAHVYAIQFETGVTQAKYRNFIAARFARIYPLHLFCLLVLVLWHLALLQLRANAGSFEPDLWRFTDSQRELETLLTNLLLVQVFHWDAYWNQPAWSISAEWLTYLLVPFGLLAFSVSGRWAKWIFVVVASGGLALHEAVMGDLGLYHVGWPSLSRCIFECGLGMLLYRLHRRDTLLGSKANVWSQIVFLAALVTLCVFRTNVTAHSD